MSNSSNLYSKYANIVNAGTSSLIRNVINTTRENNSENTNENIPDDSNDQVTHINKLSIGYHETTSNSDESYGYIKLQNSTKGIEIQEDEIVINNDVRISGNIVSPTIENINQNITDNISYLTTTKADKTHNHDIKDLEDSTEILNNKSDVGHNHDIKDLEDSTEILDNKVDKTHAIADLNLSISSASPTEMTFTYIDAAITNPNNPGSICYGNGKFVAV